MPPPPPPRWSGEASGEDSDDDGFDPATSTSACVDSANLAVGSEPGWSSNHSASATHASVHAPWPFALIWSSDAKNALAGIFAGSSAAAAASDVSDRVAVAGCVG